MVVDKNLMVEMLVGVVVVVVVVAVAVAIGKENFHTTQVMNQHLYDNLKNVLDIKHH
jgi:hypothetical protein